MGEPFGLDVRRKGIVCLACTVKARLQAGLRGDISLRIDQEPVS